MYGHGGYLSQWTATILAILHSPQSKEAPHEILAKLAQQLHRRSRLKMFTDGWMHGCTTDKKLSIQLILSTAQDELQKQADNNENGAFRWSRKASLMWDFQRHLQTSPCSPGDHQRSNNMGVISKDGCDFVTNK